MREHDHDHGHEEPQSGDDAFEVTSLRPSAPSVARLANDDSPRWRRSLRRLVGRVSARGWRLLMAGGALLITLAIIVGMIPGVSQRFTGAFAHPRPTSAPSSQSSFLSLTLKRGATGPTPTPNPTTNPAASAYPQTCPGGVTTLTSATPFIGTAGAGPVWFGGFQSAPGQSAQATLTQLAPKGDRYGLPIQVVLFIRSDTHGPVTLSGIDLHGGRALWFSFTSIGNGRDLPPDAHTPATSFAFTPQRPDPGVPTFWYGSYGTLYVPGAGCYSVRATWPGGAWRITFVAGTFAAGR